MPKPSQRRVFGQSGWSDGTANYGVVAIGTGEDGTDWTTAEVQVIAEKPILTVTYTDYQ